MARPSVAAERREQIIGATMTTIAEHGIHGTTLDRIADAVGMSRGHVRHFVGNRDKLLLDTAVAVFADDSGAVGSILPAGVQNMRGALDYLFGVEFGGPDVENAIVLGLVEFSRQRPEIAEVLTTAYTRTRVQLRELIARERPNASPESCATAAYGVLTCALGSVFLGDFDRDPSRLAHARAAAEALLSAV
ncbi:TetR/AcrR family transcriptional regulator [Microbacterium karelineae]|uniref:TetR/AcrR family transcriptional regulator n=1 Tax=Microbacterium karelineae TaxID=2654283 RepID=UPI0012EA6565|nr:TetR/AcrR family transcriptional regulator [Microbacterium karelineae]